MDARSELRWPLADDDDADPQGTFFGRDVERHVGKGEFRGMEFLHVRAKRIVNEVPNSSRMPFRFTINAYRGCSHACTYCMVGETPILMADGRTRCLADVRAGDSVYGTVRQGRYRRYVTSPVLAHWSTVKPAFRITLRDGTKLVASADHRFLTERGWKHVRGTEQGRERRPHLTLNDKLIGTGGFAASPDDTLDYRRGYLCGLIRGDGHIGSYTYARPRRPHSVVHRFRLALADLEALQRAEAYLSENGLVTQSFLFQPATDRHRAMHAIRTSTATGIASVLSTISWPNAPSVEWRKGFLAGIFDAEGSCSRGVFRICNTDREILDRTVECMTLFGFDVVEEVVTGTAVRNVRLRGGLAELLRFFHLTDPAILRKRCMDRMALKSPTDLRVVALEPLNVSLPMFDIQTGTGDFIANGVVSHNCFARPTHEYLGLNSGDDFDRRIVVKVNAVERVRAELAPARWGGHHIAMGTNTDPYQRCEGKYRLTRGIVEVLGEAANPFSILTKSTLILRDLDALAEAASHTSVRANFSIGTLDEDVWRATEPGTPHPMRRVEAVARLNQAGVPCGVLVAPILPGLSDTDDQLEAVVRACVEAGARSITPLLLHLRPGVREHWMEWLAEARPDQVAAYERLYPRSYAPRRTQDELSRRVAEMVARCGGTTADPVQARAVPPRRTEGMLTPPAGRQLSLDVR